jgi:hypothetical protein
MVSSQKVFATSLSLPDDLHQHAFATAAVEFPVEDLLPGAEVQASVRDGLPNANLNPDPDVDAYATTVDGCSNRQSGCHPA